jgi:hypothetical protein
MIDPTGTHLLNPFRNRPGTKSYAPQVTMGANPTQYNPLAARTFGFRLPILVAGWGYDIFGRPVPNHGEKLDLINDTSANPRYSYFGFAGASGLSANNPRGVPPPFGSEVPSNKYVGGPLDVRYNQRHGVWQTDHAFLAKIQGAKKVTGKRYTNEYYWSEVEVRFNPISMTTPTTPVNDFAFWDNNRPAQGTAINLSELSTDVKYQIYSELPSGTIVEMKSYLVPKSATPDAQGFRYEPIYIFNHVNDQPIFLRIDWNENLGYPAPLTSEDAVYNNFAGMTNRFLYRAEVMYFDAEYAGTLQFQATWGGFKSYNPPIYVQAVNSLEWGNPVGKRGLVAPGVITKIGDLQGSTADTNLNWTGSIIPANSKSVYPSGFSIRPISHNSIVEGRRLNFSITSSSDPQGTPFMAAVSTTGTIYHFSMANAHDGNCITGIWPFYNTNVDADVAENTETRR